MKKLIRLVFVAIIFPMIVALSYCKGEVASSRAQEESAVQTEEKKPPKVNLSEEFKSYWYAGEAEITSYKLEQARYGELRDGHAVLIYVTEPFLPEIQVKADRSSPDNISALKLNSTKKYLTGIYPYSIMSSTFYPVYDNQHALKVSTSVQEWCGHIYSQLNNRESFEIESHSYFEGEADQQLELPKTWLENEVWTKIRVNPNGLPQGEITMIPSFEYIRTGHKEFKAYQAIASMQTKDSVSTYTIEYGELNRSISIHFTTEFPHAIEGWTESFSSGFGENATTMTSQATKMRVLKTPYWRQNGTEDEVLREELGL